MRKIQTYEIFNEGRKLSERDVRNQLDALHQTWNSLGNVCTILNSIFKPIGFEFESTSIKSKTGINNCPGIECELPIRNTFISKDNLFTSTMKGMLPNVFGAHMKYNPSLKDKPNGDLEKFNIAFSTDKTFQPKGPHMTSVVEMPLIDNSLHAILKLVLTKLKYLMRNKISNQIIVYLKVPKQSGLNKINVETTLFKYVTEKYCDYLLKHDFTSIAEPSDELYKIIFEEISKEKSVYRIINCLRQEHPNEWAKIAQYGGSNIDTAEDLGDMGF